MAHLPEMPNEISIEILKELPREDLFSIRLVSRSLNGLADYLIYNQINLEMDQIVPFSEVIILNPSLSNYVRSCRISWKASQDRNSSLWRARVPTPATTTKALTVAYAQTLGCTPKMKEAVQIGDATALVLLILMGLSNLEHLQFDIDQLSFPFKDYLAELLRGGRFLTRLVRLECKGCGSMPYRYTIFHKLIPESLKKGDPLDNVEDKAITTTSTNMANTEESKKAGSLSEVVINDTHLSDYNSVAKLIYGYHKLKILGLRVCSTIDIDVGHGLDLVYILNSHSHTLRQLTLSLGTRIFPFLSSERHFPNTFSGFHTLEFMDVPVETILGLDPNNPQPFHRRLPTSLKTLYLGSRMAITPYMRDYLWQCGPILEAILENLKALSLRCPHLKTIGVDFEPNQRKPVGFLANLRDDLGIEIIYIGRPLRDGVFNFTFPVKARVPRRNKKSGDPDATSFSPATS